MCIGQDGCQRGLWEVVGHMASPFDLSQILPVGDGLLVPCSLLGPPVSCRLLPMVPGQGGGFQCVSPNRSRLFSYAPFGWTVPGKEGTQAETHSCVFKVWTPLRTSVSRWLMWSREAQRESSLKVRKDTLVHLSPWGPFFLLLWGSEMGPLGDSSFRLLGICGRAQTVRPSWSVTTDTRLFRGEKCGSPWPRSEMGIVCRKKRREGL